MWNTNSPYLAIAIVVFIVGAVAAVTSVRYRHYGVYLTHESAGVLSGEQARKKERKLWFSYKQEMIFCDEKIQQDDNTGAGGGGDGGAGGPPTADAASEEVRGER